MSFNITVALLPAFLLATVIGVTSCQTSDKEVAGARNDVSEADQIKIDGSETVFPITELAVKEFQKLKKGKFAVTIDSVGTGKGLDRFCHGKIDIVNASRPIDKKELVVCKINGVKFLELPIAYDAVSVVINPSNNWATNLKLADLKKIWEPAAQGKIVSWKDVRAEFPDTPLRMFAVTDNSGTYDYFTKVIIGKAKVARTDITATSDNKSVAKGIASDVDAIGFMSYVSASATKERLQTVSIDSGQGYVLPSASTVNNGTYTSLSRPLFIYVSSKSLTKPNVKEFIDYYLTNVAKFVTDRNYIPLSPAIYSKIQQKAKAQQVGSIFGSKQIVGLKIEDFTNKIVK